VSEPTRTVSEAEAGLRLDRWFKRHFPGITHVHLEKLLRTGQIRIDGKRAKSGDRLEAEQSIRVPPIEGAEPKPGATPRLSTEDLRFIRSLVIAEEPGFFVLNKPAGLAVQGGTKTRRHIDALLPGLAGKGERPRLVHRLDRDTSGILLIARSANDAALLAKLFQNRKISKVYWALTHGVPSPRAGIIDLALAKTGPLGEQRMAVEEEGQRAITRYEVIDTVGGKFAWVALEPVTGRTHQLRAHLAAIGHPILGDPKYGETDEPVGIPPGLQLHARRILVPRPGKPPFAAEAPLPAHMKAAWRNLGLEVGSEKNPRRPAPARRTRSGLRRP
jgi:23S rRNA pseudouridine955/2504/2580 synthase